MRHALLCMLLLLATPLFADVQKTIDEGIALYDAGRYDEAIAKFKAALEDDPSSELAAYELALTYHAKGDTVQCRALLEPRVAKKGKLQAAVYTVLGNCYDMGGDPKRAVATYRKGLKVAGDDPQLLYNLAVTLAGQGETDEARALLKKEVTLAPGHPSGHFLLARVFEAQNFRVPATIEYLRFLALEPTGERAKDAATRAVALLGLGIERKDEKNVTITIDPSSRKEEGDYSGFAMMMALAGAAQFSKENEGLSAFEKTRQQVLVVLAMFTESSQRQRDYTARQNLPFFRELQEKKLSDVFAGLAVSPLGLDGTQEWVNANEARIGEYIAYMRARK